MGYMELKLLKLICDYSFNNQLADRNFIDKLIEIVVNEKKLDDYVKNVSFATVDKSLAAYRPLKYDIIINHEAIQNYMERISRYDEIFDDFEQIMHRNLAISQIILHELEHAYQNKIADDSNDKGVEAKIIRASFFLEQALKNPDFFKKMQNTGVSTVELLAYTLNNRKMYDEYYRLNPTERLAQINSYETLCKSLDEIKSSIINLYSFEQLHLFREMLKGYEEAFDKGGICPTQVFLYGNRRQNDWETFDFYHPDNNQLLTNVSNQYDLKRRLTLGLPVSHEEYSVTSDWVESMDNFR